MQDTASAGMGEKESVSSAGKGAIGVENLEGFAKSEHKVDEDEDDKAEE